MIVIPIKLFRFGEKLEKQQQMIKERERERIQKENLEKTRKANEENQQRLREERNKKLLLNGENARIPRVTPVIQKSGQIKRVLAAQPPNNASNQQSNLGFAMIRTLGGQTYKIPVSALQGKKPGQQIVIKTGNPTSGQFTNTTVATIISTYTQPTTVTSNTQQQQNTVNTTNSAQQQQQQQSTTTTTVRPLIISASNTTNLATGISASSLQQPNKATINLTATSNQSTPQKIQFIKQITTPTALSQPISTSTSTTTLSTTNTTITQPTTTTIKLISNANLTNNSQNQSQVQIPIKLPDGRVQILQLPASMLNSSQPIQIAIPQQQISSTSNPQIIRTIQSNASPIIRTITSSTSTNSASSPAPTIIRAIASTTTNNGNPIIRTIASASSSNNNTNNTVTAVATATAVTTTTNSNIISPVIRTITPVATQPIIRTIDNQKIIQQIKTTTTTPPIIKEEIKTSNSSSSIKIAPPAAIIDKPEKSIENTLIVKPQKALLQHQQLDDQLNQSDNEIEQSSFKLTAQYKQEMVKAALSSKTNTPEIHQKLLALQKHTQQQAYYGGEDNNKSALNQSSSSSFRRSTAGGLIRVNLNSSSSSNSRNSLTSRHQSNQSRLLGSISNSKGLEDERDDIVIKTILKAMIDKIDKDEKLEVRRKKAKENQLQNKWRQLSIRQNAKLNKNADLLKKEMLKRRAIYQRNVKQSINAEINCVLGKQHDYTSSVNSVNSVRFSENSVEQPFTNLKNRGAQIDKSMQQQLNTAVVASNEAAVLLPSPQENRREMANAPVDCVNSLVSFSSPSKRKSTSIYNNNNTNLNNFTNDNFKSASRIELNANQIKKRKATKLRKLKRRKLMSNNLSENQFNDQFFQMDSVVDNQTGLISKQKRLYCICRQPYDSKRFMIGMYLFCCFLYYLIIL